MPPPKGEELAAVRSRRADLRATYLVGASGRSPTPVRGLHHVALICRDVKETIRFYQGLLHFPLVELVENRDYPGSSHFFFDIGHGNLLGFFDFPGLEHPPFAETIGGIQHLAISVDAEQFDAARERLDAAGVAYGGPERGIPDSLYLHDPNGTNVELFREELGTFAGRRLVAAD